jgi:hypothetical protein
MPVNVSTGAIALPITLGIIGTPLPYRLKRLPQ